MRIKAGYVIVLVFLGAVVAAVPGVDGYLYKQNYTELLTSLGENSPIKVKIVDYRLGWLSSDVELSLDLNPPGAQKPEPALVLTIDQHITHGPLVQDPISGSWTIAQALLHTNVHTDKKTETLLIGDNAFGIMQIDSVASFNNSYQNQVKTPLFSVKISESGKLTWQGLSGNIGVNFMNDKLQHLKSDLTLGALEVQDPSGNLSVKESKGTGERDCQGTDLCTVSSELSIPTVDALANNTSIKLVGANVKTAYGPNANHAFSGNLAYAFTKLTLPDYTVGPVSIKFTVNDVNAASVSKLLDISRSASSSPDADTRAQRFVMLAEINKELPHLITAKTVLNQDTSIATSYGNFKSTAKFYWPANTPLPTDAQGLTAMNFTADVHAATTLVQQIVKAIDAQQGFTDSDTFATTTQSSGPAAAPAATANPAAVAPAAAALFASAVPAAVAPTPALAAAPAQEAAPTSAAATAAALEASTRALLQPYVASHKLNPEVVNALVDLQKQHLSVVIYNASIDKIMLKQRLPKDVAKQILQQLKDQYAAHYKESDEIDGGGEPPNNTATANAGPAPVPAPVKTPAAPVPALVPAPVAVPAPAQPQAVTPAPSAASSDDAANKDGRLKQELDALVKQGYIVLDKDNYVISVVYDGNTMKVNGISVPLGIPAGPAQ